MLSILIGKLFILLLLLLITHTHLRQTLKNLNERLMNFYINFNLSNAIKADQRKAEFLSYPHKRHATIFKQRQRQFRALLKNFNLDPADLKWFAKIDGSSVTGGSK